MNAPSGQAAGGTNCDNWFLGVPCICSDCQRQMDHALSGACTSDMEFGTAQAMDIDPQLLGLNGRASQAQQNCNNPLMFSPVVQTMHGLPQGSPPQGVPVLGSPIQLTLTQPGVFSAEGIAGSNEFGMLPMPSTFSPFNNKNTQLATSSSSRQRPMTRARAASIQTAALSDMSDTFSHTWQSTPGTDLQAASTTSSAAATPFNGLYNHQYGSPDSSAPITSNQQGSSTTHPPNTGASNSMMSPPNDSTSNTPSLATAQKPKPIPITNDMSDAEKARLCELNDQIFAERLRIQRAKNNCAAKKSRQRRLDLIASLQEQVALKQTQVEGLAAELAAARAQLGDVQAQLNSLQAHNAELLRDKVASQQDVLSSRALGEENARLRGDVVRMQELVKSLCQGSVAGGGGGGDGGEAKVLAGSPFSMVEDKYTS
ncbi:uncharacterized protein B0I36DRAFT_360891 [Microdochium trichocladiopsis]|uniref:BZIP domain-containing protein n=1 Tax=Microdochium trichocladiopsis TaxID=1682393 RepID=A0A9P8YBP6_9PEZI|nr:uncharacterized protein B0I36DRAFT_360891 [Microdochium trichocladiopsis]KAH7035543.1 hypothetical protein B0I36DRAFT_360891 [Microdochium trichocladiopsis]